MDTMEIPNNYGLATLRWTFIPAGQQVTVTWGYHDDLLAHLPDQAATNIRSAMIATNGPAAANHMTTQWRFDGVTTLQRDTDGNLLAGQNLTSVTGTVTASPDLVAIYTTFVVSKRTAFAGRHFRGRMYPPFTNTNETSVDLVGNIGAGELGAWQGFWNSFLNDTTLQANYSPFLLHSSVPVGPTIPPTEVTSLLVRPVVGIQRRRRARGA